MNNSLTESFTPPLRIPPSHGGNEAIGEKAETNYSLPLGVSSESMQRYLSALPDKHREELVNSGRIMEVSPGRFTIKVFDKPATRTTNSSGNDMKDNDLYKAIKGIFAVQLTIALLGVSLLSGVIYLILKAATKFGIM